jgi:outer membrane protein assembly factor BamB
LWPGVVIVALVALVCWGPGLLAYFFHDFVEIPVMVFVMCTMYGPMIGAALIGIWWLAFSRVRWYDRLLGVGAFAGIAAVAIMLSDLPPMPFIIYALPLALVAWVGWLVLTWFINGLAAWAGGPEAAPLLNWPVRRIGLLVAFALSWGAWDSLSVTGWDGSFSPGFYLRGSQTAEQKFLTERAGRKPAQQEEAAPATPLTLKPGDWPGFRGPDRDGRLHGVRIAADWSQHPPKQLWRHRIGPGWSSFAVIGDRAFTQEQRGPDEAVVCYNADTGEEIWAHNDASRFTEAMAGPGPRATPTFHEGKLYAYGANGLLNCLNAATGAVEWSADVVKDTGAKIPMWGFASSPLVVNGLVMVYAEANDKAVVAYDAERGGKPKWAAGNGTTSYCSPHLASVGGSPQVLIATDQGLTAIDPDHGEVLWKYESLVTMPTRVVQPAVLNDADILVGAGMGNGTRKVHVTKAGDSWGVDEVWATKAINPYFSDMVVHKGFLYGFDQESFRCVNIEDGEKKWAARTRYGSGQVLLLVDQGLLLVVSEREGAVVLLEATPERHKEICRFQALEQDSKTWNHPVIAHGKLFVRNGEEAACYQLTEEGLAGK